MTGEIPFLLEMQQLSPRFVILIAVEDIDKKPCYSTCQYGCSWRLILKNCLNPLGPADIDG